MTLIYWESHLTLRCVARLPICTLIHWTDYQWCQFFNWGPVCLSVILQFVDLWQYYVHCIRSRLNRYTFKALKFASVLLLPHCVNCQIEHRKFTPILPYFDACYSAHTGDTSSTSECRDSATCHRVSHTR